LTKGRYGTAGFYLGNVKKQSTERVPETGFLGQPQLIIIEWLREKVTFQGLFI
jgi:hypothetical protein